MPSFVRITEAKRHDRTVARKFTLNRGSIVAFDRAYNDYKLFGQWTENGVFFVTRLKDNAVYEDAGCIVLAPHASRFPFEFWLIPKKHGKSLAQIGSGERDGIAKGLKELLERADLVVSADSGPMHLAAALAKNLVALFGPTDPKITGPRGRANTIIIHKSMGCKVPCYELDCRDNICMGAISVEDVLREIRSIRS